MLTACMLTNMTPHKQHCRYRRAVLVPRPEPTARPSRPCSNNSPLRLPATAPHPQPRDRPARLTRCPSHSSQLLHRAHKPPRLLGRGYSCFQRRWWSYTPWRSCRRRLSSGRGTSRSARTSTSATCRSNPTLTLCLKPSGMRRECQALTSPS